MANPLHPELMTDEERLDEAARIVAAGFLRGQARQSSLVNSRREKVSLDMRGAQSVHVPDKNHQGESP